MNVTLPTSSTADVVKPVVIDLAVTLGAAMLWITLSKGIGVMGKALSLPDACWQLLLLRAAAGTAVVSGMWLSGRGWFALVGILYGTYLGLTHAKDLMGVFGSNLFLAALLSGLLVATIRRFRPQWTTIGTLVFMVGLTVPSLIRRTTTNGWTGAAQWSIDLSLRLAALGLVLVAMFWAVRLLKARQN